jgi:hypothetical protein
VPQNGKPDDFDWVWGFVIALIAIVILHRPAFSIQTLLIGSRTFSFGEMALLKFISGFVTSFLIIGICAVLVRYPPSSKMIWGASVTQLLWLEIEWDFSLGFEGFGELLVRCAEEAGVLASALVLLAALRALRLIEAAGADNRSGDRGV